ncbi:hypothetical protein E3P77_00326 [Wallemia ichthyophaga]|nr:hypothetical protein E3P97_03752 [Wallemia ichthyophaga]TIA95599.1 hypothetical protein E3P95_03621 [Wallemia ichthyophaga]TIA96604.1 hypothetical protein E3P94_03628 [Wallemia ichthyophaga]TIB28419.1 hypothetical protein E3P85_03658 [Wallemia ichthyophaga]TIB43964.1 hypothetical protein E3P82_03732 [Wallemia ichthyophaga]
MSTLPPREREILSKPEVQRKATVAQLYFYDYYFDLLGYIHNRKQRLDQKVSDLQDTQDTRVAQKDWKSYCGRERALLRKRRTKVKFNHFHIICQVGQGGYGEVYLARKADTGEICALKQMRKKTLQKMDEVKHILIERDILTTAKSPWLVRLLYAFQDIDSVFLAMEFVPGGDFRTLLNNSGVLKEEHAKFYISEMFMGIDTLHKLGYIHRDLKPENFLVDSSGHVKLTDFGLATGALNPARLDSLKHKLDEVKENDIIYRSTIERRSIFKSMKLNQARWADSIVGSPDYLAAEVIRGKPYSFAVDYWSLGCILFEFLAGFPPFSGATSDETWTNLRNWQRVLRRPVYDKPEDLIFNLSDTAWDAITSLIAPLETRIATLEGLKSHPFLSDVPWDNLRETPAPFVPALDSEEDAGYFDAFDDPEDMVKYAEVKEKQLKIEAMQDKNNKVERGLFAGFTFAPRQKTTEQLATALAKPEDALSTIF